MTRCDGYYKGATERNERNERKASRRWVERLIERNRWRGGGSGPIELPRGVERVERRLEAYFYGLAAWYEAQRSMDTL